MREVNDVRRFKKVFNITAEEFIEGKWLDILKSEIPINSMLEVQFKNNFLVISGVNIKSVKDGGKEDGRSQERE